MAKNHRNQNSPPPKRFLKNQQTAVLRKIVAVNKPIERIVLQSDAFRLLDEIAFLIWKEIQTKAISF